MESLLASPATAPLLTRERVSPLYFFSYTFIPLSSIAFPHIGIFCLTARRLGHFRKTIVLYPLCMLLIWLPSVFLGVVANRATRVPAIAAKLEARARWRPRPALPPGGRDRLRAAASGDDVILRLVEGYAPMWLAALLGAAVMAAVMASDSQILALSTMFTEDVFAFYGGQRRFGDAMQIRTGRMFVVLLTVVAYVIALRTPQSIFDVATPVRVRRLLGALAAAGRGALLAAQHEMGRAGQRRCGPPRRSSPSLSCRRSCRHRRRELKSRCCRRAARRDHTSHDRHDGVWSVAGRAHDDRFSGADGRDFCDHAGIAPGIRHVVEILPQLTA